MTLIPSLSVTPSDSIWDSKVFLNDFESFLFDTISKIDAPLRGHARKVVCNGGKRIRPLLCFFSSQPNYPSSDIIKASTIIELVHVATLVHDDVLDNAKFRRNQNTIHQSIGNHDAILLGDALFSYGLELSTDFEDSTVCKIVSKATRKTCSGEIAQNDSIKDFSIPVKVYEDFISDKTGCLFGAACRLGGFLSKSDPSEQENLELIGLSLGINYQLYDDIIDAFGDEWSFGKTLGTDFLSFKPTLPSILLLEESSTVDKEQILEILSFDSIDDNHLNKFVFYLEKYGILEKCISVFHNRIEKTRFLINSLCDEERKQHLSSFFDSFSQKLSLLNKLKTTNFLAVHT